MKRVLPSLLLVLLAPELLSAQEARLVVPFGGTQAFCHILHHFQLRPLSNLSELREVKPEETLVVIFGDTEVLERLQLPHFLEGGGAMLLASDRPDGGRLKPWQLSIDGRPVVVGPDRRWGGLTIEPDPLEGYKGSSQCPQIDPFYFHKPHPVFLGLAKSLATNCPSYVEFPRRDTRVLGSFSSNCYAEPGKNSRQMIFPRWLPFLVGSPAEALPAGRFLIMSGHGMFMNGMMAQPDNDNFLFAWNCVRWLREAPAPMSRRKYVLFVDDGRMVTNLQVPLVLPPPPPVPPVVVINRLLRGLEEENFFHRLLYHVFSGEQVGRFLLVGFSAVVLVAGTWVWYRGHYRPDSAGPLTTASRKKSATALLTLRHQAQANLDNYGETAQGLLQQFFLEAVYPLSSRYTFSSLLSQHGAAAAPLWPAADSWWWRRWRRRRQLQSFWQLAQGKLQGRITAAQLRRLVRQVDELRQALAAGELLVAQNGPEQNVKGAEVRFGR